MRKFAVFGTILAGATLTLALAPAPAPAQTADPQIFIQQSGTSPAGGDPNLITNTGAFTVGVAGGTFTLQDPLLIIVGVYDNMGAPSVSFSGCADPSACPSATTGTYGLNATTATFTAASGGTAYSLLGLNAGGSESFGNWSAADVANNLAAPTSFQLYAFALNTNLSSQNPITIDEAGAANGSFIIGYSCENGTATGTGGSCATNGDIGQTPFTNAGLISGSTTPPGTEVPEPASLLLLGSALAGLGLLGRRRRQAT